MEDSILKRFIGGMLATGLGSISVIVLGMLGLILSARLLPTEVLGAFFILQVLVLFTAEGSSFGITMALERWLAGATDPTRQQRIFTTALIFRALTALLGAVALGIALPLVLTQLQLAIAPGLVAMILAWLLLEALLKLLLSQHQARFQFGVIGRSHALSSVINFGGIILFVALFPQGLIGLLYAKLASRALALAYAWSSRPLKLSRRMDLTLLRSMLRYALPLYANYFLSFAATRADTLLIGGILGAAPVAFYEVARRIPDSLMQLYEAFRQVYFPFVVRSVAANQLQRVSALINNATRFGALALGLGCLIAFAFGEEIIVLLFSDTYLPSVLPFALMMLATSLLMIEETLGATLAALGDSAKPLMINLGRTALQVVAYGLLIPSLEITGAALSVVLAAAAVLPINVYFLRRWRLSVRPGGFAKPLLIAGSLAALIALAAPASTLTASMLVLAYVPLSLLLVAPNEVRRLSAHLLATLNHTPRCMPEPGAENDAPAECGERPRT